MHQSFRAAIWEAIEPQLNRNLPFVEVEPILHAFLPCFSEEDAKKLFSEELLRSWGK
jgi:hypothetical protein